MSLTESELDRLADYTAGVLGPREAAEVAQLLWTDSRWAAAYEALRLAEDRVRAALRIAHDEEIPMPADVIERVDAALAAAARPAHHRPADRQPAEDVVRLDRTRPRAAPRRRLLTGLAAAAAAVVAIVGGVAVVGQLVRSGGTTAAEPALVQGRSDGGVPAPAAPSMAVESAAPGMRTLTTGTNYRPETLAQLAGLEANAAAGSADSAAKTAQAPGEVRQAVPSPLSRLTAADALAACLSAVLATHPGTVTVLDYARFRDEPALVILVRRGAVATVVAVGPLCGMGGAAEMAAVPVS